MKHLIWETLYELLNEEYILFKDVRIKDICEKGDFHRSTFYRHFTDKYDLLDYGLSLLWQEYFEVEQSIRIKKPFQTANNFYKESKGRELFSKQLNDDIFNEAATLFFIHRMTEDGLEVVERLSTNQLPKTLLADFLVGTIMVVDSWGKAQPGSITPTELDNYFEQLVCGSLGIDFW